MKKIFAIAAIVLLVSLVFAQMPDREIRQKLSLIKKEIIDMGYTPNWIIISGKRPAFYNKLLPNAAKDSYHLKGQAIDIYIFDIDGDYTFTDNDIRLVELANSKVERNNPKLMGGFGTYSGKFAKRMIHLDTRGYPKRFKL